VDLLTFSPLSFLLNSHIDFCWRLLIGLGAVPGAVALYFRLTLPETPRFTMDVGSSPLLPSSPSGPC
jgi:hypothetical protein